MTEVLVDLDAERTLLGAALVNNAVLAGLESQLHVQHFADPKHRAIYTAMLTLAQTDRPVDTLTLRDELQAGGSLDEAGGLKYLGTLCDDMPRITNAEGWARIVRDKARRRAAIALGQSLIARASSPEDETDELLDKHHTALMRLLETTEASVKRMDAVLPEAMRELDAFVASPVAVTGVPTGLPDLDRVTGGLKRGALFILGARPARGKSVMLAQIAAYAASKAFKVLVFSMEMPPPDVAQRMLLAEAEVERWDLWESRDRESPAWARIGQAYATLQGLPVWFDARESPTMAQVRATARQQLAGPGLDLVVIDYLQRMAVDPKADRWLAVGDLAKGLKSLARNLRVPVLAACQLNAEAEEKRPTLANLGQAQSIISAEADIVAFLHPDDLERWKTQPYPVVSLLLDKHRAGATMSIPLSFERARLRFVNLSRRTLPEVKQ